MAKPDAVDNTRKTYFTKRHIKHGVRDNHEHYEAGEPIELTAKEAAELLAIGAIEAPREAPKPETVPDPK